MTTAILTLKLFKGLKVKSGFIIFVVLMFILNYYSFSQKKTHRNLK